MPCQLAAGKQSRKPTSITVPARGGTGFFFFFQRVRAFKCLHRCRAAASPLTGTISAPRHRVLPAQQAAATPPGCLPLHRDRHATPRIRVGTAGSQRDHFGNRTRLTQFRAVACLPQRCRAEAVAAVIRRPTSSPQPCVDCVQYRSSLPAHPVADQAAAHSAAANCSVVLPQESPAREAALAVGRGRIHHGD